MVQVNSYNEEHKVSMDKTIGMIEKSSSLQTGIVQETDEFHEEQHAKIQNELLLRQYHANGLPKSP